MSQIQQQVSKSIRSYQAKTGKLLTIGTVESATGGRIGDKITNVPGSSDYYKGSVISYSNDVKIGIVGVKEETIRKHGAVSSETAIAMAQGGKKLLKVDVCIADTGITGPGGATSEKSVGLFYIALSAEDVTLSQEYHFQGSRESNKQKATDASLDLLKEYLEKCLGNEAENNLEEKHAITCFLEHGNKILILRRSHKVGTYQRCWAGVSGYIETNDLTQAFTEISEETELYESDLKLIKQGKPLDVVDRVLKRKWIIHPFLFHVKSPEKIKTNWEHTEVRWIKPEDLGKYRTVPGLKEALNRVIK
jgi:PncC family amidohydrolase